MSDTPRISVGTRWSRVRARARRLRRQVSPAALLALVVLLGATAFYAHFVGHFYPLGDWLFFIYARYWAYLALFGLACLSAGHFVLRRLLPVPPPLGERLALSMALGVLVFFTGTFLAGLLGLFGRAFFFAWPLLLIALGARELAYTAARAFAHLRRFGVALILPRGAIEIGAAAMLLLGLIATYLVIIVPRNLGADALWYHLPIAERYAAVGRIGRFRDGWYLGAYPQLASVLYAWAFQSPGHLSDHAALSAHLEWFLFLVTLGAVAPLARRLLRGRRVPYAGAAVFLFPQILLYDSSLIAGADHVLAFWAAPLGLALIRCGRRFDARNALLAALLLSGALLTKYQACYFAVAAGAFLIIQTARTRRLGVAGLAVLAIAVATAPHWLKNLVFYGDPFFPLLYKHTWPHPFHAGAGALMERTYWMPQFQLQGTIGEKVRETLKALVDFSFVPHDWDFHGDTPVFGSLFTLSLLALPFIRAPLRVWLLVLGTHVAIAVWFITSHQDRFLQALVPWMAASTVAMLALTWRQRPLARAGVVALVALQLVWGSDVYFFRVHGMIGDSPIKLAVDLIASGHEQRYDPEQRFRISGDIQEVGRRLPRSAVLLLHDTGYLGAAHDFVSDAAGWQGAIDYLLLDTPEAAAAVWRRLRVTHLVWSYDRGGTSPETLAREAVFIRAAAAYGADPQGIATYTVARLVDRPLVAGGGPTRILWAGCEGDRTTGVFSPAGLASNQPLRVLPAPDPPSPAELAGPLADVNAAVLRPGCNNRPVINQFVREHFHQVMVAGDAQLFIR